MGFALLSFVVGYSQIPKSDFQKAEVVWYGLDFTQCKLVGSTGFTNPQAIHDSFFHSWNSLLLSEADKYNLKEAFKKPDIKYDIEMMKERNLTVEVTTLVQEKEHSISKEQAANAIATYNIQQQSGYGVVFVIESFNKYAERGSMWVVVFEAATKKPLITERFESKPGGFGLRNYWAATVHNTIKQARDKYKWWFK